MLQIVTSGFLDAVANLLVAEPDLALVKGTNLFALNLFDDPDEVEDHLILYDEGYESVEGFRHVQVNWNLRLLTTRKGRVEALDALRPVINALEKKRNKLIRSDAKEDYKVLTVRPQASSVITAVGRSGRHMVEATLQFQVIPF